MCKTRFGVREWLWIVSKQNNWKNLLMERPCPPPHPRPPSWKNPFKISILIFGCPPYAQNAKDKRSVLLDEFWEHFNWNWEDDGRILLGRNSRKRLQVPVEKRSYICRSKRSEYELKQLFQVIKSQINQDLSCRAAGDSEMMSDASFRARDAFCSPSAAITWRLSSIGVMRFNAGFGQ